MSGAVNQLVNSYLAETYPKAARILATEALLNKKECKRAFGAQSIADVLQAHLDQVGGGKSRSSKHRHNEDEVALKPRSCRKVADAEAEKESSDDEIDATAVEHKPSRRTMHAGAHRDDDDNNESKSGNKKTKVEEEEYTNGNEKKNENEEEDTYAVPRRHGAAVHHGGRTPAPQQRGGYENNNGAYKRFQRIDPTKVTFHSEELRDNRPRQEHLTLRQNQEMMRVKGKNFNKLKQKNKGKFYGAGVDLTVRAYQFPDSDDE